MITWSGGNSRIKHLAFSPDGRFLATVGERVSTIRVWDPLSGNPICYLRGRWGNTMALAVSPDGRLLATLTDQFRVILWDTTTWEPTVSLSSNGFRHAVAFAPDGLVLAVAGTDGLGFWSRPFPGIPLSLVIHFGDPDNTSRPKRVFEPPPISAGSLPRFDRIAFTPDGRFVAGNGLSAAVVWDAETGEVRREFPHTPTDVLTSLAFSPDATRLGIGFEKTAEVREWATDSPAVELRGHQSYIRAVGFTPDGGTVVTASNDGTARFWDAATGAEKRQFDWGIGKVMSAAFAPDGLTCAAGGERGQIVVWDVDP